MQRGGGVKVVGVQWGREGTILVMDPTMLACPCVCVESKCCLTSFFSWLCLFYEKKRKAFDKCFLLRISVFLYCLRRIIIVCCHVV